MLDAYVFLEAIVGEGGQKRQIKASSPGVWSGFNRMLLWYKKVGTM